MEHRYKWHIHMGVLIALLMALPSLSYGQRIAIVPSSEAAPYQKAQQAIEKHLVSQGHITEVILLKDLEKNISTAINDETKAIVAIGSQAATHLHKRIKPPILLTYCMVAEPAKLGLEEEPALQGISTDVPLESQFKLISEALPGARTVGMLYNSQTKDGKSFLTTVKSSLPNGWQLKAIAIDETKKYETVSKAIEALFDGEIDVVWTHPDSSIYTRATVRTLLLSALRKNVPVFGFSLGFVNAGALLGIAIEPETQGRKAAELTLDLLKQQDTSRTENDEKEKFEIALNMIVAEQLAVKFPEKLIKRAQHIFRSKTSGRKEGK